MPDIPPHFHKTDRISEKDLIPDDTVLSVVPDYPAPEGTEVSYLNGNTFRRYRMIKGVWQVLGGGSPWELIGNAPVDSITNFEISDLEGDTHKMYRFIFRYSFTAAEPSIYLRLNNVSTAAYLYVLHRVGRLTGSDNHSNSNPGATAQSNIPLWDGSFKDGFLDLTIHAKSGFARIIQGRNTVYTDNDNYMIQDIEGIWTNTADELTSLNIQAGQNFLEGSEYWLYRAIT